MLNATAHANNTTLPSGEPVQEDRKRKKPDSRLGRGRNKSYVKLTPKIYQIQQPNPQDNPSLHIQKPKGPQAPKCYPAKGQQHKPLKA